MPATKAEAEHVFRIVNGYLRMPVKFLPCDNDAECTGYMICGKKTLPGTFTTMDTPPAWINADHFHINLEHVPDFNQGGANALAFLICHEMGHNRIFPPMDLGYWVQIRIIRGIYHWGSEFENMFRTHMDILVNEWMFRDKKLQAHLQAQGLDVYAGALQLYSFSPPTTRDEQLHTDSRWGLIRYNELAIMRETDPARFATITPKPRYKIIENFVNEYLSSDYKTWDGEKWFEFINRSLLKCYDART